MIDEIYHNNVRYLEICWEKSSEQEGDETFNLLKMLKIKYSYRRHDDVDAAKALDKILKILPRMKPYWLFAFTYFLHLFVLPRILRF